MNRMLGAFLASAILAFPVVPAAGEDACDKAGELYRTGVVQTDPQEKIRVYLEALRYCPGQAKTLNNLADAYDKIGYTDKAEETYKAAVKADPKFAVPLFSLGDLMFKESRYEEAIHHYEKALALSPGDETAETNLVEARKRVTGKPSAPERSSLRAAGSPMVQEPGPPMPAPSQTPLPARVGAAAAPTAAKGTGLGVIYANEIVEKLNPVKTMGTGGVRTLGRIAFKNILFESGSAEVESGSLAQLNELGKALTRLVQNTGTRFVIEGHTDNVGGAEYNQNLSQRRAEAVKAFLVTLHRVPTAVLEAIGFGLTRPIDSNDTDAGRANNRRVEVRIK